MSPNGPGIPAMSQGISDPGGPHEMVRPTIYVVINGPPGPLMLGHKWR